MFKKLLYTIIIAFILSAAAMFVYNSFIPARADRFATRDIVTSTFIMVIILAVLSLPGMAFSTAKWCKHQVLKLVFYFLGLMLYAAFVYRYYDGVFGPFFIIAGVSFILPYAYFYYATTSNNSSTAI